MIHLINHIQTLFDPYYSIILCSSHPLPQSRLMPASNACHRAQRGCCWFWCLWLRSGLSLGRMSRWLRLRPLICLLGILDCCHPGALLGGAPGCAPSVPSSSASSLACWLASGFAFCSVCSGHFYLNSLIFLIFQSSTFLHFSYEYCHFYFLIYFLLFYQTFFKYICWVLSLSQRLSIGQSFEELGRVGSGPWGRSWLSNRSDPTAYYRRCLVIALICWEILCCFPKICQSLRPRSCLTQTPGPHQTSCSYSSASQGTPSSLHRPSYWSGGPSLCPSTRKSASSWRSPLSFLASWLRGQVLGSWSALRSAATGPGRGWARRTCVIFGRCPLCAAGFGSHCAHGWWFELGAWILRCFGGRTDLSGRLRTSWSRKTCSWPMHSESRSCSACCDFLCEISRRIEVPPAFGQMWSWPVVCCWRWCILFLTPPCGHHRSWVTQMCSHRQDPYWIP